MCKWGRGRGREKGKCEWWRKMYNTIHVYIQSCDPRVFRLARSSLMEYDKSISRYRSIG